jgi:hypothetical protein
MQKMILIGLVVLALVASACQAATPTEQETALPPEDTAAAEATALPTDASADTAAAEQPSQPLPAKGEPMPGCRVVESQLTPNPTLQALFPAIGEEDWSYGPSDATVTITDYSDFQ